MFPTSNLATQVSSSALDFLLGINRLDTPFAKEGQEMAALLRRKAPDEEFSPIFERIQSDASERALDPIVASTDVFMTAVAWVGSKSLSHVLACIDRSKGRLLDLGGESESARTQIITSVLAYWHAHPGVALSIIEKLLNYSIVTPFSVVDWALSAKTSAAGQYLAEPHVFELVSNTVAKVTGRVRQILTSSDSDEETRDKEVAAMRDLFRSINDALSSWASGSKDEQMEDGDGSSEPEALIRRWGQRWLRVFQRMAAIEEAFVLEANKNKTIKMNGTDE
jgi:nuclear cap-binding protein subunit 1